MEQIGQFVSEYADWVYIGCGIMMVILFLYVSHKIKRVEKRTLLLNGEIKEQLQQLEKQIREQPMMAEREMVKEVTRKKEDIEGCQTTGTPEVKKTERNAETVTLINDVLEEIFP